MNKIYTLFLFISSIICNAQDYSLNLKNLVQINTNNGGNLVQSVLDDGGNTFFTGYANGNDFHFDGYIINPVGLEDLYLIKTDLNGNHLWEKTLNAGSEGTIRPRYIKVDTLGNSYVMLHFTGIINIGSSFYNSSLSNGLLIKLDSLGNYLWATQIADSNLKDYDICFSNNEMFVLSSSSSLYRINLADGSIISSFNSANLTSIDYKNSSLYVGGYTKSTSTTFNNIIVEPYSGFVLKGNEEFNFDSYVKFRPQSDGDTPVAVKDVKVLSDGSLEIAGLSRKIVTLTSSTGLTIPLQLQNTNREAFLWCTKIKYDFSTADWFKGNDLGIQLLSNSLIDRYDIDLFPFGDSQAKMFYRYISDVPDFFNIKFFNDFSLANVVAHQSVMLDLNKLGLQNSTNRNRTSLNESLSFKYINNLENLLSYDQKTTFSVKKFIYLNSNYNLSWTKLIPNYHGGTIASNYLKSDTQGNSYINYTSSGEVNLLGETSFNTGAQFANTYAKIDAAGQLSWSAAMYYTLLKKYANSKLATDVNADGEFITSVSVPKSSPAVFVGNSGAQTVFQSGNLTNLPAYNQLVKISNTGELLWSKRIDFDINANPSVSVIFDRAGDIIVWATDATFTRFGSQTVNANSFIAKINGVTGNTIFFKTYSGLTYLRGKIAFDELNNIYAFYEPRYANTPSYIFEIGDLKIPSNNDSRNSLMVKLDSNGNPVFGKNFYENLPPETYSYSVPLDVKYDGTNFIQYNYLEGAGNKFVTLDGTFITTPYAENSYANSLAKISKDGAVLSVTPILSVRSFPDGGTIDLDENGNIYLQGRWNGNFLINNQEYANDSSAFTSNVLKFGNDGVLKYIKKIYTENNIAPAGGNVFGFANHRISVVKQDLFTISGDIISDNLLSQPINFKGGDNYYLATLEESYLQTVEAINKELSIYPNPTSDFIYIDTKEKISNIEIYDATGRKVISNFSADHQFDVRKLLQGIYYIRINTAGKNLTSKFIKK